MAAGEFPNSVPRRSATPPRREPNQKAAPAVDTAPTASRWRKTATEHGTWPALPTVRHGHRPLRLSTEWWPEQEESAESEYCQSKPTDQTGLKENRTEEANGSDITEAANRPDNTERANRPDKTEGDNRSDNMRDRREGNA